MWALLLLRYLALALSLGFTVVCVAAGLFYIGELVEEYTQPTKRILRWAIVGVVLLHALFLVFETFPWYHSVLGIASHALYYSMLKDFPSIELTSPRFIGSGIAVLVNHGMWFWYFGDVWVEFEDLLGIFLILVWLVPFTFFLSLSAGDNTLPYGMMSSSGELDGPAASSPYVERSKKRASLFMNAMNGLKTRVERIMPFSRHPDKLF